MAKKKDFKYELNKKPAKCPECNGKKIVTYTPIEKFICVKCGNKMDIPKRDLTEQEQYELDMKRYYLGIK